MFSAQNEKRRWKTIPGRAHIKKCMNFKNFNTNTQFWLYISILENILPLYTKFEVNWPTRISWCSFLEYEIIFKKMFINQIFLTFQSRIRELDSQLEIISAFFQIPAQFWSIQLTFSINDYSKQVNISNKKLTYQSFNT